MDSESLEAGKCPEALLLSIIIQKNSSDKVTFEQSIRLKCGSKKCRYLGKEYSRQKEQQVLLTWG